MTSPELTRIPRTPHSTGLSILVVDDEEAIRGPIGLCLETLGHHIVEAGTADEALFASRRKQFDIVLLDVRLGTVNGLDLLMQLSSLQPRTKIIIMTAYASVEIAVKAMTRGATDFLCKPFTPDELTTVVARATDLQNLESTVCLPLDRFGTAAAEADFGTTSEALQKAVVRARRLAPGNAAILISGENGTGKNILARAIHGWGAKPEEPFLGIDCAAFSVAYVDLAVFGDSVFGNKVITAEKAPLIRRATTTLKLAHIEALAPVSQQRLAKLISTRQCEMLDGKIVDLPEARIVATMTQGATITDSLRDVFGDAYIDLPSLRERLDDFPMLAQRYLGYLRHETGTEVLGFTPAAMETMMLYSWPGNLSELRRVVGKLVEDARTSYIERTDLPQVICEFRNAPSSRPRAGEHISLAELEVAHIRAIVSTSTSLKAAADTLGLDFQALYRRRKQYGLE